MTGNVLEEVDSLTVSCNKETHNMELLLIILFPIMVLAELLRRK